MKYFPVFVYVIICVISNCGFYTKCDGEVQGNHSQFIKTYLDNEYQGKNSYTDKVYFRIFTQNELVKPASCDKGFRRAYTYWFPNSNCFGITLENNETVFLHCTTNDKNVTQPGCFKAINQEQDEYTTCIKILGESCVGITTAGNFSVVFSCHEEYDCYWDKLYGPSYTTRAPESTTPVVPISADSFTLSLRLNQCFQLYQKDEVVADNICSFKKTHPKNYFCLEFLKRRDHHCSVLTTPANETIEISCNNDYARKKTCYDVYDADESLTKICHKNFGDYVIGITTPSNYSIILHSHFCETFINSDAIKFTNNFLFKPEIRSCYKVFKEDQDINNSLCLSQAIHEVCVHEIKDTNCTGITTQNNETVILSCTDENERTPIDGCFKIYTDNNVHTSCQQILKEGCVGITTPSNLRVLFECYECSNPQGRELPPYDSDDRKRYRPYVQYNLKRILNGNFSFQMMGPYQIYRPEQYLSEVDCHGQIAKYYLRTLHDHDNCLGVTLDNHETIVMECPNRKPDNPGCFDVFSPIYDHQNRISGPNQQVQSVCSKILEERCVGIITPRNWTMTFACTRKLTQVCGVIAVRPNTPLRI